MNVADIHTIKIQEHNGWLIVQLNNTPKITQLGIGVMLNNYSKPDVLISSHALSVFKEKFNKNLKIPGPALEILSYNKIWLASKNGLLISPSDVIHIYKLPIYTECDNVIDPKLLEVIK